MKLLYKSLLPVLIALALAPLAAYAQDEDSGEQKFAEPGLYTTTDEGHTYLIQDGKVLEMAPGESGFAGEDGLKRISSVPSFLNWPCSGDAAQSRKFATYAMKDLTDSSQIKEIIQRYFEIPEVIEPIPNYIDGDFHGNFTLNDIIQFSSPEYWYSPNQDRPFLDQKRPRVLDEGRRIVAFVATMGTTDALGIDDLGPPGFCR